MCKLKTLFKILKKLFFSLFITNSIKSCFYIDLFAKKKFMDQLIKDSAVIKQSRDQDVKRYPSVVQLDNRKVLRAPGPEDKSFERRFYFVIYLLFKSGYRRILVQILNSVDLNLQQGKNFVQL